MIRRIAIIALVVAGAIGEAAGCTSALVGAGAALRGYGMLWKHRDSGFHENFIQRVNSDGTTLGYTALFNGGDSLLTEAWTGVNDAGFAVMNTASYNLAPDTAKVRDREGLVMSRALGVCRTVDDFAALLDTLPRPLGVQANFGVLDASGAGAYFETDDHGYRRYDLQEDSVLIRTNFSCSGQCGDGLGLERYAAAEHLILPRIGEISPRMLTDTVSSSFYNAELGGDARELGLKKIRDNGEFIPRRSTSASVVIEMTDDGPLLWVILGYPPLSKAQVFRPDAIPEEMLPTLPGGYSRLARRNLRLRDRVITRGRDRQFYVNLRKLPVRTSEGGGKR